MARNFPDVQGVGTGPIPSVPLDLSIQRENAGFIAPRQSALNFNLDKLSINAAGIQVPLHTVPPGKTLLVTDFNVSHDGTSAVRMALQIGIGANAITIWSFPVKGDTAPFDEPGIETQFHVPAGQTLYFVSALLASANVYANINCIEQPIGVG